jgi:hypothetical protein
MNDTRFQLDRAPIIEAVLDIDCDLPSTLDWMPSRNRTFTLSAGKTDCLPYAWLDGTDRGHAVAKFTDGRLSCPIRRMEKPPYFAAGKSRSMNWRP